MLQVMGLASGRIGSTLEYEKIFERGLYRLK